jgi:hypothetical protein
MKYYGYIFPNDEIVTNTATWMMIIITGAANLQWRAPDARP